MLTIFYDCRDLASALAGRRSVFLGGPTARVGGRTAWRARASARFAAAGFEGALVIPEFEARRFEDAASLDFGQPPSPTPSMRATSYNILDWETTGIERASLVLFWMPFSIANEHTPDWLPGFTTRSEVSRELVRCPERLVLGMPDAAYGASHIRYHAHQAQVAVHPTLDETLTAALTALGLNNAQV